MVGALGVLIGILVFFGWCAVFSIRMVFLLNFVFVTCMYLVFSPPKNSGFSFYISELTLERADYFRVPYAKKYGLKKVRYCQ